MGKELFIWEILSKRYNTKKEKLIKIEMILKEKI